MIFKDGVKGDPRKLESMVSWLILNNLKSLRDFLGLIGYYRKFIRNYGQIEAPLIALLKKDAFQWLDAVGEAF